MSSFDRSYIVAHGAYGRDTTENDWTEGKDFKIVGGPYFSIRDIAALRSDAVTTINFVNQRGYTVFVKEL